MRLPRVYRSLRWPHFSDARLKVGLTHYSWSCVCTIFKHVCTCDVTYFYFQSFIIRDGSCSLRGSSRRLEAGPVPGRTGINFGGCCCQLQPGDQRHRYFFCVLDLIASGYFDFVLVLPPAATWSRARHKSNAVQDPLRSRSFPLGISLSPDAQSKILLDNDHLEYAAWILECSLLCERAKVDSILVFLEDLGRHEHHGPAVVWQLRECQVLECDHDARRGAGFLCQLAHAEHKRPLGILTTLAALHSDLCMGWPKFVLDQNELRYFGPLPRDCGCPTQHSPMVGYNSDQQFSHLFLLPLDHCSGNVFGRLKVANKAGFAKFPFCLTCGPGVLGSAQHRLWACPAFRETRVNLPPTHQHQGQTATGDKLKWERGLMHDSVEKYTPGRTHDGTIHAHEPTNQLNQPTDQLTN